MTTGSYRVELVENAGNAACTCENCGWAGPASLTIDIGSCALTPGDSSPVGRCPDCDGLAYLDNPLRTTNESLTPPLDQDDVPVSGSFLSLVQALQAARTLYINERLMAEGLDIEQPEDWHARCEKLFMTDYAAQADAIGLKRNLITFEALLNLRITDEVRTAPLATISKTFVFNPWLGMGRGGIKRILPHAA